MNKTQFLIRIALMGIFVMLLIGISCEEPVSQPKRYGFPKIEFPQNHDYTTFSSESCPFTFDYPDYGKITRDMKDSCWVDISFPNFDLTWHLTYGNVQESGKTRGQHFEEYRRLVYKHSSKASHIDANPFDAPAGRGTMFELYGEVGTPEQIFLFDSTEQEIMMMSFYFRTASENDSLAPISEFMKTEVKKMLNSFQWK